MVKKAGWRGFYRPNGGASTGMTYVDSFQGTTVQVCGLYPFIAGSAIPLVGVPLGHNIFSGSTICCDPISWFARANLINNPSMFVFGNPGLGKSTLIRRLLVGYEAQGIMPLILGDLRPDYVDVVKSLGGQIIDLQEGVSYLNVLDPGDASLAKDIIKKEISNTDFDDYIRLEELQNAIQEINTYTVGYQYNTVFSLISLLRGTPLSVIEGNILSQALRELQVKFESRSYAPILQNLLSIIRNPSQDIRDVAMDRYEESRYKDVTQDLMASLMSLVGGGRFGTIFAKRTTSPMKMDKPVVFDISKINSTDKATRAAVLMACWTTGFGTVQIAKILTSLGLIKQKYYFIVMDEMHQALGAGIGMVERIDYLTRLNRAEGVGQAMITHTPKDLLALPTEEERMKASGFVERSGLKVMGGLSKSDMDILDSIIDLSESEKNLVTSWQSPAGFAKGSTPPGRGNFLIKIGGKSGIPLHVSLTQAEINEGINATSSLWEDVSK